MGALQMGHKDVRTTMVYTHVLNRGMSVRSPLEELGNSVDEVYSEVVDEG